MSYQWRTKDGRLMDITDMSTKHLENTVQMLDRKGLYGTEISMGGCQGDYWYDEIDVDYSSTYANMKQELRIRRLEDELTK